MIYASRMENKSSFWCEGAEKYHIIKSDSFITFQMTKQVKEIHYWEGI